MIILIIRWIKKEGDGTKEITFDVPGKCNEDQTPEKRTEETKTEDTKTEETSSADDCPGITQGTLFILISSDINIYPILGLYRLFIIPGLSNIHIIMSINIKSNKDDRLSAAQ